MKADAGQAADSRPSGQVWIDEGALGRDLPGPGLAVKVLAGFGGADEPAEQAVKRKRGRPRKNPAPTIVVSAGPAGPLALEPVEGTGVVGQVVAPAKRGPGRPRKNLLPAVEAPAVTIAELPSEKAGCGIVTEPAPVAVKRKPGRPRKQVVPEPAAPLQAVVLPAVGVPGPKPDPSWEGICSENPGRNETVLVRSSGGGTGLVDRFGIGPGNKEGIGFWPPKPEEIQSVKTAAVAAGVAAGWRRGRKPRNEDSTEKAPGRPLGRSSFGADAAGKPFCGKCGTYTRIFQPETGPARRVCPKCHPEKIPEKKSPLDKTGMPCKDRGVCRPERCVMAFDCEEMKKFR